MAERILHIEEIMLIRNKLDLTIEDRLRGVNEVFKSSSSCGGAVQNSTEQREVSHPEVSHPEITPRRRSSLMRFVERGMSCSKRARHS